MERGKGGNGSLPSRSLFAETHRILKFFMIPIQSLYRPFLTWEFHSWTLYIYIFMRRGIPS